MLASLYLKGVGAPHGPPPTILLCDHGTPTKAVNDARTLLGLQLRKRLGSVVRDVIPCAMERRPDAAYDFNDPLLEAALSSVDATAPVVVALMFLQPGKHAGAGGDIAQIIATAVMARPSLAVHTTGVLGVDPLLIDILADRVYQAVEVV